ncbi:hypothetical protein [Terrisporobacter vanillatitrophus]|uniref:hypothetical protein n=1 Tax=Terrisporobacter vanillatitrophus TaxID=3058402 RepID=UPI003242AAAD
MNKDIFNELDILEQIDFINKKLKEGYSLSKLDNENIISSRKTISNRFKKVGYELNKESNQYENTIEIVKPEVKQIITTNTQKQESSNIVVQGDQVNNKALEQFILNYADMNDKLNEVYKWYQESSNNVVVEDKLEINDFEGNVVVRSYKLYEPIQKEFAEFCSSSKFRVQDILSQALKEFLDKYK